MHTDFSPLAVHESHAINNGNQTISTSKNEDSVLEQAVAFEPTDSANKSQRYCSKKREPLNDASQCFH